jgi:hypothetical protein
MGVALEFLSSNFNSADGNGTAVRTPGGTDTRQNIIDASGGWPGTGCIAADPQFVALGDSWAATDLHLQPSSPNIGAGVFPFVTLDAATDASTLALSPVVAALDARRIFRAGDLIQIEGTGTALVASVDGPAALALQTAASWQAAAGVWFRWSADHPDIGALPDTAGIPEGGAGGAGGHGGASTGGSAGQGMGASGAAPPTPPAADAPEGDAGCGCQLDGSGGSGRALAWLGLLLGLGLRRAGPRWRPPARVR